MRLKETDISRGLRLKSTAAARRQTVAQSHRFVEVQWPGVADCRSFASASLKHGKNHASQRRNVGCVPRNTIAEYDKRFTVSTKTFRDRVVMRPASYSRYVERCETNFKQEQDQNTFIERKHYGELPFE